MKDFFSSQEFQDHNNHLRSLDTLYDVIEKLLIKLGYDDEKCIKMWDLEVALDEVVGLDFEQCDYITKLVSTQNNSYTSIHEIQELKKNVKSEAFKDSFSLYLNRMAQE